jgi:hypothetical protein
MYSGASKVSNSDTYYRAVKEAELKNHIKKPVLSLSDDMTILCKIATQTYVTL